MEMIEIINTMDNSSKMRCVVCNASLPLLENGLLTSSAADFNAFCEKHGTCTNYADAIPRHRCRRCGSMLEAFPAYSGDPDVAVLVRCSNPSCEGFFGFYPSFDEARAAVHRAISRVAEAAWEALKGEPELLDTTDNDENNDEKGA